MTDVVAALDLPDRPLSPEEAKDIHDHIDVRNELTMKATGIDGVAIVVVWWADRMMYALRYEPGEGWSQDELEECPNQQTFDKLAFALGLKYNL